MHGGAVGSGAQEGNRNALKHGRYTAEALASRWLVRELVRAARGLVEELR
jgi:glucans biosynthesis protein